MTPVARVTLLTQDDCAFCDHAKNVLARLTVELAAGLR
jgi:glutaredoxin